jgi:predicted CXXCH cytochrome family protein
MRKTVTVASLAAFVLLACATLLFAHHGPAKVTIDAAAAKQPGVPFDHGKHAKTLVKSCDTCHHTNKGLTDDTDAKVQKCSACHLDPKDAAPSMREMSMTKNPYHSLCVGCHKTEKKGPTLCKDCHKK